MKKLSSILVPALLLVLLSFNFWSYGDLNGSVRKVQDIVSLSLDEDKQLTPVRSYGPTRQIFIFDQARQFPKDGVLLFGDSITDGLWFPEVDGIPVLNAGVGGVGVDWLVRYLPEVLAITKPRVVVVTIGINDIPWMLKADSKEKAVKDWALKYSKLIDSIIAGGAMPVPSTILPIKREARLQPRTDLIMILNKEIIRIAEKKEALLCDSYTHLAAPDGFMGPTGMKNDLHPSKESYHKWRLVMENSIRLALKKAKANELATTQ